jgi:hypothetical protein
VWDDLVSESLDKNMFFNLQQVFSFPVKSWWRGNILLEPELRFFGLAPAPGM